ncbi:MAG: DUF87 domain-containing protein [Planctomycetes bacterium]|nr:DUF87 domain-containing protein [Planctomycetota bacterium]
MEMYEKLGAFYLGRRFDADADEITPELLLYDAKDLTTHAVCVGMTGSGKTGLCVTLLEEAALDGIPSIVIDPKGDIGNLLLTFPDLKPESFRPWIDESEAARKGMTPDEYAVNRAELWTKGLADWGQTGERIQRFRDAVDLAIYTPGSDAGRPLAILRSLTAPSRELIDDADLFRDRVQASVSGLLGLLGIAADPLRSREHILVSNILDHAWRAGRDVSLADLINQIQAPPFERLGVFDLESFFPASDRMDLALRLNGLLASPGFASWSQGEPLDAASLLYTKQGKPRVSVISIAHLSDAERMFFVTLLLNEVVSWMRKQPGTNSLRAILYMDEVFGYLPPTANPPSKLPMLLLLKQARAFGLGCVLATQNPVDVDYKALSNCGTWFLGRLQTERDKARVIDGLEGAAAGAGKSLNRAEMDRTLSGLSSRVFVMNNVHDEAPEIFHVRWAMSYLRGPMNRVEIRNLQQVSSESLARETDAARPAAVRSAPAASTRVEAKAVAPVLPPEITQRFLPARDREEGEPVIYRPALLAEGRLHFVSAKVGVDEWRDLKLMTLPGTDGADWDAAEEAPAELVDALEREPCEGAGYDALPASWSRSTTWKSQARDVKDRLYRSEELVVRRCKVLDAISNPGESEGEFRARLAHAAREHRDLEVEKLRKKWQPKIERLQDRIARAEQRVEKEEEQYGAQKTNTMISIGATILGALFGRKAKSIGTVGRAATAARGLGRAAKERGDIERAEETLEALRPDLEALEREMEDEVAALQASFDPDTLDLDETRITPRKSDIAVEGPMIVWTPWSASDRGPVRSLFV